MISGINCIDLIKKLNIDTHITTDNTIIIKKKVCEEIEKELDHNCGRIALVDLVNKLNVDILQIEEDCEYLIQNSKNKIILTNGDLLNKQYINNLINKINDSLEIKGILSILEFSQKNVLNSDFVFNLIKEKFSSNSNIIINKNEIYTKNFIEQQKTILNGILNSVSIPTTVASIQNQYNIHESAIKEILGNIKIYYPKLYINAQKNIIQNWLIQNGYIEFDFVKQYNIDNPKEYLLKIVPNIHICSNFAFTKAFCEQFEANINEIKHENFINILNWLPLSYQLNDVSEFINSLSLLRTLNKNTDKNDDNYIKQLKNFLVKNIYIKNCYNILKKYIEKKSIAYIQTKEYKIETDIQKRSTFLIQKEVKRLNQKELTDELKKQIEILNNELKIDENEVIEEVVKILKENLEEDYKYLLKSVFVPQNNEYQININEKLKLSDLIVRKYINLQMKSDSLKHFKDENIRRRLIDDLFENDFNELSILILAFSLMINLHDYTLFIDEKYNTINVDPIEKSLAIKNLDPPLSDLLNNLFQSLKNKLDISDIFEVLNTILTELQIKATPENEEIIKKEILKLNKDSLIQQLKENGKNINENSNHALILHLICLLIFQDSYNSPLFVSGKYVPSLLKGPLKQNNHHSDLLRYQKLIINKLKNKISDSETKNLLELSHTLIKLYI
ncbi:hypothetical protein LY90DRAFT_663808 [Neocallimastix californiae]|uniref:Uncharacterized protein n=1 Tax=Neocallimastix californiae TaxID=1754190 RepID=A0A1Y2FHG8_9FUNG|nr:hypothetical protein LY90DRAFT_663808 [Neocallimastix californiae]|eukprot:ORY83373.1 hypothetical protein LY90DRAFT_663808 [Neocallimastix californiae]